ncbi:LytR/AlgR family response regulator transcription factor [Variovorax saccharolyticus]|uniref:LytR/AlgR family response regulator transcription factor n=1 Tax=Variovorax saccharolyticus TaxID=3053516 RepID=UPI0025789E76|nr:LytTR family DNA-binding domain-containing protein [Variovorax sp. J22R187]MDM0018636.1 LytTR family DNA-binding domain-containing protein [Variovorax sp. J22R187]
MPALRTLIVDDESLARSRLRALLADCNSPPAEVVAEAAHGEGALAQLASARFDLVLLDIHMPGLDGLELARQLRSRPGAPAVVFVTAYAAHAVTAFELEAVDYLTKPVRAERLQQALQKAERYLKDQRAPLAEPQDVLLIQDRGRTERVPLSEILYLKSELKYLTVRTASRSHIFDGSLAELEERYPARFVRVHRNALVARAAIRTLEKYDDGEDAEGWALRLDGIPEPVMVSRRQLSTVREALKDVR